VHGVPLYRDIRKPPYIGVLYGPVIPSLVAVATPLFGSGGFASLKAGRVVAVCSTIAVCLLIFLLAKRQGARPAAALIGSLAFALSPMLEPWGFAFRVDTPVLA